MDFYVEQDDQVLAEALRGLLARACPPEVVRGTTGDSDLRRRVWNQVAGQGLAAVLVPEALGGLGLGWTAGLLGMMELGRAAVPGPFVDTVAVATTLLGRLSDPAAHRLLAEIAEGSLRVGYAERAGRVAFPHDVDAVVVCDADRVVVCAAGAAAWQAVPGFDEFSPVARLVDLDESNAMLVAAAPAGAVAEAWCAGALATSAQLVGVTSALIELTRGYVAQREQFGRSVASFQAVQHALVDAALRLRFAEPVVLAAGWAFENRRPQHRVMVSHAKAAASAAGHFAARTGLQLHGAMGFTGEYNLSIWFKRVRSLMASYGGVSQHRTVINKYISSLADCNAEGHSDAN